MEICGLCGQDRKNEVRLKLIENFKKKNKCMSDKLNQNGRELRFPVIGRVQITGKCSSCDLGLLYEIEKNYI
jgi:hypothetical protein